MPGSADETAESACRPPLFPIAGAVLYDAEGRVVSVFELDAADGAIRAIRPVINPGKLRHIGPVSDAALRPD